MTSLDVCDTCKGKKYVKCKECSHTIPCKICYNTTMCNECEDYCNILEFVNYILPPPWHDDDDPALQVAIQLRNYYEELLRKIEMFKGEICSRKCDCDCIEDSIKIYMDRLKEQNQKIDEMRK